MARKGGLGPQGHAAIQTAVEELNQGNPAATSTQTDERETLPDSWWTPKRGSNPKLAMRVYGGKSTRIAQAGYDQRSQRLYVLFHKPTPEGTTWTYEGVPPQVWRGLRNTDSPGRYVNTHLNDYNYHKGQWGG